VASGENLRRNVWRNVVRLLQAGVISLSCHDTCDQGLTPTRWITASSGSATVTAKTETVAIAAAVVVTAAAVAAIQLALSDNELFATDRGYRQHKTASRRRQRLQDTSMKRKPYKQLVE